MTRALVQNTLLGSLAGFATTLATFAGGVVVARLLKPEGVGALGYAVWCIGVAISLADLGVSTALQRYIPELNAKGRPEEASGMIGLLARVTLLSVIATLVLLFAWLQFRKSEAVEPWILADPVVIGLILATFVAQALGSFYTAYLKGGQRFGSLARLSLATSAIQFIVVAVGAWWIGVAGALAGYVAAALLPAVRSLPFFLQRGTASVALKRRVVRFAFGSWFAGIIGGLVWARSEIVFLEAYAGLHVVGLFAAAATLAGLATTLPALLTGALLPFFGEQHGAGARDRMQEVYRVMTLVVALLVLPACFGLAAIAPVLVPVLFGSDFVAAAPAAMVLLIPAAVGAVAAGATNLIYGVEKSSIFLFSNAAGLVGTVAFGFLVIPRFGLMGAAWARAAVHTFVVAIETWYLCRRLGYDPPWRALASITLAAALSGLAAHLVVTVISGPICLLLAIPAAVVTFAVALRLLDVISMLDPVLVRQAAGALPAAARPLVSMVLRLLSPTVMCREAPDV